MKVETASKLLKILNIDGEYEYAPEVGGFESSGDYWVIPVVSTKIPGQLREIRVNFDINDRINFQTAGMAMTQAMFLQLMNQSTKTLFTDYKSVSVLDTRINGPIVYEIVDRTATDLYLFQERRHFTAAVNGNFEDHRPLWMKNAANAEKWLWNIYCALQYMHGYGFVHLGLNSWTVRLETAHGDKQQYAKLSLFPFVTNVQFHQITYDNVRVPDYDYVSPEIVAGGLHLGLATDWWEFGVLMIRILFNFVLDSPTREIFFENMTRYIGLPADFIDDLKNPAMYDVTVTKGLIPVLKASPQKTGKELARALLGNDYAAFESIYGEPVFAQIWEFLSLCLQVNPKHRNIPIDYKPRYFSGMTYAHYNINAAPETFKLNHGKLNDLNDPKSKDYGIIRMEIGYPWPTAPYYGKLGGVPMSKDDFYAHARSIVAGQPDNQDVRDGGLLERLFENVSDTKSNSQLPTTKLLTLSQTPPLAVVAITSASGAGESKRIASSGGIGDTWFLFSSGNEANMHLQLSRLLETVSPGKQWIELISKPLLSMGNVPYSKQLEWIATSKPFVYNNIGIVVTFTQPHPIVDLRPLTQALTGGNVKSVLVMLVDSTNTRFSLLSRNNSFFISNDSFVLATNNTS